MGAVTVSAFRVAGFVVPIHVKTNRAATVAIHRVDSIWNSKSGRKARWSVMHGSLTLWTTSFSLRWTIDLKRASRLKSGGFKRRHNAP